MGLDAHIDGAFWDTVDGYEATPGDRDISITLNDPGLHVLELRNRSLHSYLARTAGGFNPANYTMRFVSLTETGEYDVHDIAYTYDALSRLQQADYDDGGMVYTYDYDVVGNRTREAFGSTTINLSYNQVNQLIHRSWGNGYFESTYDYDLNGNLVGEELYEDTINIGGDAYAYDRANRMLEGPNGLDYRYDGLGNRIVLDNGMSITNYLLDMQPGLTQVIGSTTFARFRYTVDGRGNRVRAVEALRTGDGQVVTPSSSPEVVYLGSWTGDTTGDPKAILRVPFASDQITLEMGEGPNHSLYGVYIDGALWGTLDGYSASSGTRQIAISLNQPDPHLLEIRSRARHSWRARTAGGLAVAMLPSCNSSPERGVHGACSA